MFDINCTRIRKLNAALTPALLVGNDFNELNGTNPVPCHPKLHANLTMMCSQEEKH